VAASARASSTAVTTTGTAATVAITPGRAGSRVVSYDDEYASGTTTFVGDITLDANQRIAKVTYESTNQGRMKPGVKGDGAYSGTDLVTMELSDYGTPVRVERPTHVVVAR
jgi:hypothetical protein